MSRSILEASKAFLAEATCLVFLTSTRVLQYGHVLVFCPSAARNKPPHLLHVMIKVVPMYVSPKDFSTYS